MTTTGIVSLTRRRDAFGKGSSYRGLLLPVLASCIVGCKVARVESAPAGAIDAENEHVLADVIDSAQTTCSIRTPRAAKDAAVSPPRVFVEAFLIALPSEAKWHFSPDSIPALAHVPRVKMLATPHMIATLETQQTMDLGRRLLPPGATLDPGMHFESITVLAHLGDSDALVLDVDIALQMSESRQAPTPSSEVHVRNAFVLQENRVSWLPVAVPGYSSASLLLGIKSYFVRDQSDLRNIFECKMLQRQRSLARRQLRPGPLLVGPSR